MKKVLFLFPIFAFFAVGCNSSQQASSQTPVEPSVVQNTSQTPAPETPITFSDVSFITNKGFLVPTQTASSSYGSLKFLNSANTTLFYPDENIVTFGYASTYQGTPFVLSIRESDNSQQSVSKMQSFIKSSCLENGSIGNSIVISQCPSYNTHYASFMTNGHSIIVSTYGIPDSVLQEVAKSFQ